MGNLSDKIQEYAKLMVEVGVNLRKGQTLVLFSPVEHAPFARLCADAAYARSEEHTSELQSRI